MTGKVDFRNRRITTSIIGEAVVVNELNDLYVLSGNDWIFYGHARVTGIFEQKGNAWKLVHMHGSFPDSRTEEGEQIAIEKIEAENQQLREAVKRRTVELEDKNRELQIEAALEKVRTVAMGMKSPEDMLSICKTISQQLESLGLGNIRNVQTAIFYPDRGTYMNYEYYAKHDKTFVTDVDYQNHPIQLAFARKMMQGAGEEVREHLTGKDLRDWYAFQQTTNQFADEYILQAESLNYYWFSLGPVALGISTYAPLSPQEIELFKRFIKVFELAYQRYLDIEKALIQAREAHIESALERVRSRGMGMQKSEDLKEVIQVVYDQMVQLKLPIEHTGFILDYKHRNDYESWIADHLGSPSNIAIPYFDALYYNRFNEAKRAGASFFALNLGFEEKNRFYQDLFEHLPGFPETSKAFILAQPALTISTVLLEDVALYIENFSGTPYNDEENGVLMRFGKVFQQTYTRFLDLKKAEAQAREAQVEAALERVRARAMAMQKSKELVEVVHELRTQMGLLGQKELETCVIQLYDESPDYIQSWAGIRAPDSGGNILAASAIVPKKGLLIMEEVLAAYEANRQDYVLVNEGEKLRQWFTFLEKASPESYTRLVESVQGDIGALTAFWSFADFEGGSLLMVTRDKPDDYSRGLLRRFSNVFGLAYRRFADIRQAEAQAREAQVEAALERVRSKTMAMHNSQDVGESVATLFEELVGLGVLHPEERCGIGIMLPNHQMEAWTAAKIADGKADLTIGLLDMTLHPLLASAYNGWVDKKDINQYILEGEDRIRYYEAMLSQPSYKITRDHYTGHIRIFHNDFYFKEGCLYVFSERDLPEASLTVYTRFAAVFGQTYRRYQDLLKAEAQAREAQIEAALESIRSKAMAMRTSEDIAETTAASFAELKKLGISSFRSGVGILTKGSRMAQVFADTRARDGQTRALSTMRSMDEHPALQEQYSAWEKQEDYEQFLSGDELVTYYSHPFFRQSNIDLQKNSGNSQECGYYFAFPDGLFYAWSHHPYTEGEKNILRRFRNIISLTFRRYLDLQKAEAQAREATKQASLDRVRAVIASMRSTEDLELITPLIFKELTILGVPFIRCGVFIIHEDRQIIDAYLSSPSGASLGVLHLPFHASELTIHTVEAWRNGEVHRQHWSQADFIEWTKQMMDQHQIESSRTYQGADSAPESLDLHFVPFTQGMLYVGSLRTLDDQDLELVLALARSFAIAYARYEDFVKLETAKADIESTLTELKATQAQLIQSEKMASLGELTAGIAHEIQNPLNFVNNFSDLNKELIEELQEELKKGDVREAASIAENLKDNEEKINLHGRRADGIVKSMLQHSRSSSGQKEPTDVNKLVDEYTRLAYHGFRARNKDFNVTLDVQLDPEVGKVPMVSQDIGRVLLNLFNNAFQAVEEKAKTAGADYRPTVTVTTTSPAGDSGLRPKGHLPGKSAILIAIADNGPGIPDTIKDKIFQPFFTTKPTGQGTGLGLSLSYDIIKAHGGEITVSTQAGEGSTFMIQLPTI